MKNLRQRGELALTLSLLGIFISLIGIGIGTGMSRSVQQSTSQAQTGDYPYRSILEIRDENNQLIKWMPGLIWATTYEEKIAGRNNGDIKDSDGNASLKWEPKSVPLELQDTMAQISIGLPAGYRVVSSFCTSVPTSICANMKVEPDSLTYSRISVEKNGYISYGIRITSGTAPTTAPTTIPTAQPTQNPNPTALPTIVPTGPIVTIKMLPTTTPTPTITPTPTSVPTATPPSCPLVTPRCAPRNVEITEISKDSVEISWDNPQDWATTCGGLTDNPKFWIDIVNTGKAGQSGYIACTSESGDTKSTCKIAKNVFPNRLLNKESFEFINKSWIENQEYLAQVFLFNPKYSCVSPAGEERFTYEEKTPEPELFCKVAGQDCTVPDYPAKCTASDGKPGLQICRKVGMCTEPGDESKCSWDQAKGSSCTKCESTGPDDSCKYLGGNPNATERIVFLPVGFGSIEEFEQVIATQVNSISVTNLSKYKDRFNYSMFTKIGGEGAYGCVSAGSDDHACELVNKDAIENAQTCNGNINVIVVPSSWQIHLGYAWLGGRSIVLNVGNFANTNAMFPHEIGHAIFDLADEYIVSDASPGKIKYHSSRANCSKSSNGTCKWGNKGECIEGCFTKDSFRSSENSVMNTNYPGYPDFNLFNNVSFDVIDAYFGQKFAYQVNAKVESEYKNALFIHLTQPVVGTLNLESVESIPTYPRDIQQYFSDTAEDYFTLLVKNPIGQTLWETQLRQYTETADSDKGPELTSDFYEYLPYFKTASSILITDAQGKTVLTVNLKEQNIAPPMPAGNLCGNSVCDAGNGETANSCRVDCGEHLVKSELERSDLDLNKQVNTQDMAILIDEEVYGKSDKGDIDGNSKTNALDYSLLLKWLGRDY